MVIVFPMLALVALSQSEDSTDDSLLLQLSRKARKPTCVMDTRVEGWRIWTEEDPVGQNNPGIWDVHRLRFISDGVELDVGSCTTVASRPDQDPAWYPASNAFKQGGIWGGRRNGSAFYIGLECPASPFVQVKLEQDCKTVVPEVRVEKKVGGTWTTAGISENAGSCEGEVTIFDNLAEVPCTTTTTTTTTTATPVEGEVTIFDNLVRTAIYSVGGYKPKTHMGMETRPTCPVGAAPVTSAASCEGSARILGKVFGGEVNLPNYPRGCSDRRKHDRFGGVWWNNATVGDWDQHPGFKGEVALVCFTAPEPVTTTTPATTTPATTTVTCTTEKLDLSIRTIYSADSCADCAGCLRGNLCYTGPLASPSKCAENTGQWCCNGCFRKGGKRFGRGQCNPQCALDESSCDAAGFLWQAA